VLQTRSGRAVALAVAGAVIAAVSAGAAVALSAADTVQAPYAQAAVTVNADGSIAKAKSIAGVTRVSPGMYCVRVSDPGVTVANSVPMVASHTYRLQPVTATAPAVACGGDPQSVLVTMEDQNGAPADGSFSLVVD
jgi:hypothetical protein